MATKYSINADPVNYTFPAGGRFIMVGALNEPLPPVTTPIDMSTPPGGYVSLGACENSEVTISLNITTESVTTGIFNTERRKLITGQGGSVESVLQFYEPEALAYAGGASQPAAVSSTSLSRAFKRLVYGGSLGSNFTLLIPESLDITLVKDDGTASFEETWFYTPKASKDGDINLSQKVGRLPAINFRFGLLGFSYLNQTVLLQHLWIQAA